MPQGVGSAEMVSYAGASGMIPSAGRAFFNDTNPNTYRVGAATEAWDRVLRFYRRTPA